MSTMRGVADRRGRRMKSEYVEPLLLTLAREQEPPVPGATSERYDEALDQLLVLADESWVPAATRPERPPQTKKADIERGEDVKGW